MENNPDKKESKNQPYYTGGGIAIGVALGAAFDNVGLGLALGIAIGAALDYRKKKEI